MAIARGIGRARQRTGHHAAAIGRTAASPGTTSRPLVPQFFNSARYDAFDQWAMALRDQRLGSRAQSAQYLPADLRMYGGALDRYGAWNYEAPYGYVWYPTVAPDWRPYYDGYWSSVPTYGWTWIGANAWSWPTHHYGRWGYARSRWFWIPDRRLGAGLGIVGRRTGLRELVSARLRQSPGLFAAVDGSAIADGMAGTDGPSCRAITLAAIEAFVSSPSGRGRCRPMSASFTQTSGPVAPPRAVPRRGGNARTSRWRAAPVPDCDRRDTGRRQRRTRDARPDGGPAPAWPSSDRQAPLADPTDSRRGQQFPQSGSRQPRRLSDNHKLSRQPQVRSLRRLRNRRTTSYDGQNRGFYRTRPPDATIVTPAGPV